MIIWKKNHYFDLIEVYKESIFSITFKSLNDIFLEFLKPFWMIYMKKKIILSYNL